MKLSFFFPYLLILIAWVFFVLVFPLTIKICLTINLYPKILTNFLRVIIPGIIFLAFLYTWYTIALVYINKKLMEKVKRTES
ncbi:MAG: hypothetical protein ACTSUJ_07925 [Candidatus Njordarchaeales archaeon]